MCVQLFLDVEALGAQLREVGVEVGDAPRLADYCALRDAVRPDLTLMESIGGAA